MNNIDAALICKALSDSNRLMIVELLTHGEMCTCELIKHFSIRQPTLTHHLMILSECDLLKSRKDGTRTLYALNCETLTKFREFIAALECR
ncbi:MAG: winged helix-turn-helix transcriptional regulator [Synergistaceae bacterium]|nr:winged helix-turn-helix transcriptional regulator [Synergistaceae bacterium]MBQ3449297.1 winged helix-turn-helix transcriptional regulator [Synergistaceae bacterium]MBQ3694566.1 winged helix-turn-helix transcriptional regulator [Synergistaceae bacterium]MBQ6111935.1 winged helix-turn-helix transcriptional regulator [Synergistaceae bacterium]MBQ9627963.1 winged helix-turn-helix transcriptional regulator [Synergistaceae bacterium]